MLNPVKNIFSKIESSVRSQLARRLNSEQDIELKDLTDEAMDQIAEDDCIYYTGDMLHNIALTFERHVFE
ncbi:hypothetical protein ENBRE01_3345 [Enteropsectra breve]|nr:hypothetical protein ENBRE01_3345 [Enteropsectra breve]